MKKKVWKIIVFLHLDRLLNTLRRWAIGMYHSLPWYFSKPAVIDKLPLPPPHLAYLVTANYDLDYFYASGQLGSESIKNMLLRSNLTMETFKHVLDFGCGCGRIIRHWQNVTGPKFYGTDYNRKLIHWCKKNLVYATFGLNGLEAKLNYPSERFDLIYAYSVFTHLDEELQNAWMKELIRILVPGGYLLITTHGRERFFQLDSMQIEAFERGEMIVLRGNRSGTNYCSAYHPEAYVRKNLAKDLEVLDFGPGMAKDGRQDMYLLRKPLDS